MRAQTKGFEGVGGRVAGAMMARLNRDMEAAAIEVLDPSPGDAVLTVGFGPGVGVAQLVARLPAGRVCGIDPAAAMVDQAIRRNRAAVGAGRVELLRAAAESIPYPDAAFAGVLAVNSAQLWHPLETAVREVARVLRPGGALVAVTHAWAIEKHAPLEGWIDTVTALLRGAGLGCVSHSLRDFRSGAGLVLAARPPPG
jgi:ubiquinone/menaquinone biosynthesis C-methylase UbiE